MQHLPRTRQRRKQARPQELLEAALSLFVERGLANTRSEDVAHRAGVSKGTLYLYYPSKAELFKAVVRAYLSPVIVDSDAMVERFTGPTSSLLHLLGQNWWQLVGSTNASRLVMLIMAEAGNFPDLARFYWEELVAPTHNLLARVVQRGIDRGELRQVDVSAAAHALLAPAHFLVMYHQAQTQSAVPHLNGGPWNPQQYVRAQIDLLLAGLALPTPQEPPPLTD